MKRKYKYFMRDYASSRRWPDGEGGSGRWECKAAFIVIHNTRSNGESLPSGSIMWAIVSAFPFAAIACGVSQFLCIKFYAFRTKSS